MELLISKDPHLSGRERPRAGKTRMVKVFESAVRFGGRRFKMDCYWAATVSFQLFTNTPDSSTKT